MAENSLISRMKKVGLKSEVINKSDVMTNVEQVSIDDAPVMNIALSGDLNGGLESGVTILAGPSKHFKTLAGLTAVAAFLKTHEDGICLFFDSEYGTSLKTWESLGIDMNRVLHIEIEDIEQLKFDIIQKLEHLTREDKVIIFIDSLGNLASKKELQDAIDGKSTADMTRAREIKSLYRMLTPRVKRRRFSAIIIAHTYNTMELYSKAVVSGGTGQIYSANTIIIFGRQQEKDSNNEIVGYNFIMNIEKSRAVKEKSKLVLEVRFDEFIDKYSGMIDLAIEGGFVTKGKVGRSAGYAIVDEETGEIGEMVNINKIKTEEHLGKVMKSQKFADFIKSKYLLFKDKTLIETDFDDEDEDDIDFVDALDGGE